MKKLLIILLLPLACFSQVEFGPYAADEATQISGGYTWVNADIPAALAEIDEDYVVCVFDNDSVTNILSLKGFNIADISSKYRYYELTVSISAKLTLKSVRDSIVRLSTNEWESANRSTGAEWSATLTERIYGGELQWGFKTFPFDDISNDDFGVDLMFVSTTASEIWIDQVIIKVYCYTISDRLIYPSLIQVERYYPDFDSTNCIYLNNLN